MQAAKQQIDLAVAGEVKPHHRNGRLLLRTERGYKVLVDDRGRATRAGDYYADQTGTNLPTGLGIDYSQQPERRGATEYIKDRKGKIYKARTWDGSKFNYSAIGKRFFSKRKSEFVVEVPVQIHGIRDGRGNRTGDYIREAWMPTKSLGIANIVVSETLTEAERKREIERIVLEQLPKREETDGRWLLHEESQERWYLDDSRDWRISELKVTFDDEGGASTRAILHRPLQSRGVSHSFLPCPECILPEAFEGESNCVALQVAALRGVPVAEVEWDFTNLDPGWEAKGASCETLLAYCAQEKLSAYIFWSDRLIQRYVVQGAAGSVCAAIWDDHIYIYQKNTKVQKCCAAMRVMEATPIPLWRLKTECPPKQEVKWSPWPGVERMRPGANYCSADLDEVRIEFLRTRRNPKVSLSGIRQIKKLTYVFSSLDGRSGQCAVHRVSRDADAIKQWYWRLPGHLDLRYEGENLPFAAQKVLFKLLRAGRAYLTAEQRAQLHERQGGKCAVCDEAFAVTDMEADHITPLCEGGTNEFPGQWQFLCRNDHQRKTESEAFRHSANPLESRFDRTVYDSYVRSPKTLPLVLEAHPPPPARELMIADCRRCRFNALFECAVSLPVFGPLDGIEECGLELGDLTYIEKRVRWQGPATVVRMLPFQGSGWYTKPAAQWLLHTGKIVWADCKHKVDASCRHPANYLREALATMEDAWGDDDVYRKLSINSMIGTFAIEEDTAYMLRSSGCEQDLAILSNGDEVIKIKTDYGEGLVWDYVFATRLERGGATMRPIHDLCLHAETTRLAQMCAIIEKLGTPPRSILQFKTDSVLFDPPARKRKAIVARLNETTFADLSGLYDSLTARRRLDSACDVSGSAGAGRVWRCHPTANDADLLHCKRALPVSEHSFADEPRAWRDVDAREAVERGESCGIFGAPGTGKSALVRELYRLLAGRGEIVRCAAKTHVAAAHLPDGVSLNSFANKKIRRGRFVKGWLILDEINMIDSPLWAEVCKLLYCPEMRFVCVGDFNQYGPFGGDRWQGRAVEKTAEESSLLFNLCGGNRCTMATNYRSDPRLFDFCRSICPGGARRELPLARMVAAARREFPLKRGHADYSLCVSHAKRRRINREVNLARKSGKIYLKAPVTRQANAPQDFWIYAGQRLIACMDGKEGKLYNGGQYTVLEATYEKVRLKDDRGDEFTIKTEVAVKQLRMTHALTYACIEGLTLPGRIRLCDADHRNFDWRKLNVGLSRGTAADLVEVE